MNRKIAVVTGTRAEYGLLYPVIKAIEVHTNLKLSLVVTGMHLSHEFGYTVNEIEKDGFPIAERVDMLLSSDTPDAMATSIGLGIIGMTQTWEHLKPDIILVLGDRVEPLAAAISGAYLNIPVAHVHGGDTSKGGLDESARHAITKFTHIHFPATERSAERIIRMGEDEWRVHTVGSPALDVILNLPPLSPEATAEKFGLDLSRPLVLAVQHPVTTQVKEAAGQMRETLEAIVEMGYPTVLVYPNADAGGRRMIELIKEYNKYPFITTFKSLPRKDYLGIMKLASVIVGNSSSGIVEAPSFGLPTVNIGIRQEGRERSNNIIDVAHDRCEILKAVDKVLNDKQFLSAIKKCDNPYGDGKTGMKVAEILSKIVIDPRLLQKKIAY